MQSMVTAHQLIPVARGERKFSSLISETRP